MTGFQDPAPSLIDHLLDIQRRQVQNWYPFQAATLSESEYQLVEIWQSILQGQGAQMFTQASSKLAQKAKKMHQ